MKQSLVCVILEDEHRFFSSRKFQDKSSTEEDDAENDFIPNECILEFKSRSNVIKKQREALRQQLLNNFKQLCVKHCKKEESNEN